MSIIPSNLGRVPTLLASQVTLRQVSGTNAELLRLQSQVSTLRRVNRPSDDPVASTLIDRINRDLGASEQYQRNLTHAAGTLNSIDQVLGQLADSVNEVKQIASSQVGVGSDAATRRQQASVIDSYIRELYDSMNRDLAGIQLFAGSRSATRPVEVFGNGYRYVGGPPGSGLGTELGPGIDFPITISADTAVGSLNGRVTGSVALDAGLSLSTPVSALRGNALGQSLGSLTVSIDPGGGPVSVTIDLTQSRTVGDVTRQLESAIRQADPGALAGAFPSGVGVTTDGLSFNVAAGYAITFSDGPSGTTADALSLSGFTFTTGTPTNTSPGADLNPRVTDSTLLGNLHPVPPLVFGDIVFTSGGRSGTVTTSAGMTVGEFREAVARLNLGVRAEIDASGDSINLFNEVAGHRLSISESTPGAASTLGIRTLQATTALSTFNDGRGVQIADGVINPITGLPDPAKNVDFRITTSHGVSFDVDLDTSNSTTVQNVLDAINNAAALAGLTIGTGPGQFLASLSGSGNGIALQDTFAGGSSISVTSLNGHAAEDLGLLDGSSNAGNPAVLAGSDRTSVRVDSLFSTLIELRDALLNDDARGITLAGSRIEQDIERLSAARATVGGRARRVEEALDKAQDTDTLNQSVKSRLQDLDLTEASGRLALLQTQLQAGYLVAAQNRQLSLLNFLR